MRAYSISGVDFFGQTANQELAGYFAANAARCKKPMQELISAANLRGKSILSIGSKIGHEEVWFHADGCRLSLCDLDEHGDIEPILKSLPSGGATSPTMLEIRECCRRAHSATFCI